MDDYRDAADSTALLLASIGLQTEVAYDGADAFSRVKAWQPHVCILDLAMPHINGFDLAHRIREMAGPGLLLIAVTGWVNPGNESVALESGFDYFMRKPVSAEGLLRVIKSQLLMWPTAATH